MPTLVREDTTLYYEVTGRGAPVLLIQGVGVIGHGWRPQVEALSTSFQMLTFDNRGLGQSVPCRGRISIPAMADDALALLDAVGWPSAHVVGHSMGGLIAQHLALEHPERVRGLSLLCTFSKGSQAARPTPWMLWQGLRLRIGTRRMRRRALLNLLMSRDYRRAADLDVAVDRLTPLLGHDPADRLPVMRKQLWAMARYDRSGDLGRLGGIPALVISAAEDPIAPPRFGRRLAKAIGGTHYQELQGASHGVTIEAPHRVNPLLRAFFTVCDAG
jgi:pimeloyl-ACP methyl ester carboxylesterase